VILFGPKDREDISPALTAKPCRAGWINTRYSFSVWKTAQITMLSVIVAMRWPDSPYPVLTRGFPGLGSRHARVGAAGW